MRRAVGRQPERALPHKCPPSLPRGIARPSPSRGTYSDLKDSGLRARMGVRAARVLGPLCLPVGSPPYLPGQCSGAGVALSSDQPERHQPLVCGQPSRLGHVELALSPSRVLLGGRQVGAEVGREPQRRRRQPHLLPRLSGGASSKGCGRFRERVGSPAGGVGLGAGGKERRPEEGRQESMTRGLSWASAHSVSSAKLAEQTRSQGSRDRPVPPRPRPCRRPLCCTSPPGPAFPGQTPASHLPPL